MIKEFIFCVIEICHVGSPCYELRGKMPEQMIHNTVTENRKVGATVTVSCEKPVKGVVDAKRK